MKKYVVAEGYAFTANGHIYSAGDEISESVFADKVYFSKLLSEKKILQVSDKKETVEEKKTEADDAPAVEENTETEENLFQRNLQNLQRRNK